MDGARQSPPGRRSLIKCEQKSRASSEIEFARESRLLGHEIVASKLTESPSREDIWRDCFTLSRSEHSDGLVE